MVRTEAKHDFDLKEKFVFLHVKPHYQDIYHHIQYFTALLEQTVQSRELELVADVTAG